MEKIKLVSNRPLLRFSEVFEQYDVTVEDLFQWAADGNLTIYYQMPSDWKVMCFGSINQLFLKFMSGTKFELSEKERDYLFELIPELKELIVGFEKENNFDETSINKFSDELFNVLTLWQKKYSETLINDLKCLPTEGFQEIYSLGPITFYPNKGIYKFFFIPSLVRHSPLSQFTILQYRSGIDTRILLKSTNQLGIPYDPNYEYFVVPDTVITIETALKDDKLSVIEKELKKLLPKNIRYPAETKAQQNGEQKKLVPLLPEICINEIIEEHGGKLEELFYWAAHDKLTIYFQSPPNWKVKSFFSYKSLILQAALGTKKEISREEIETVFPDIKNAKNIDEAWDVVNKATKRITELETSGVVPEDFNDQEVYYLPPITRYPDNGKYHAIYVLPIESPCRISPFTFVNYLKGEGLDSVIVPKLNYDIKYLEDPKEEFYIAPESKVTIQEALEEGKLFVKRAELDALNDQNSHGNLSEIFTHQHKSPELPIAVRAWQAAVAQYEDAIKNGKKVKPKYLITEWLLKNHPELKQDSAAFKRISILANWDDTPGPIDITDTK